MRNMILDSIGNIDNDMVESVAALRQRKPGKQVWFKWAAMAVCLCLVVVSALTLPRLMNGSSSVSDKEQKYAYSEAEFGETFGQLLPTTFLEGYELDETGIAIYGENPAVLQAAFYNEALDDIMTIRVAKNAYFENIEYGVILYGDTKADGSKSSQIYYESGGYTIMFQFCRSDIAEMDDFEKMVRSAPCYRQ